MRFSAESDNWKDRSPTPAVRNISIESRSTFRYMISWAIASTLDVKYSRPPGLRFEFANSVAPTSQALVARNRIECPYRVDFVLMNASGDLNSSK